MNSSKLYAGLLSCGFAVAGLTGCYVSTEPFPGPEPGPIPVIPVVTGTVTVSWTVAGSHSAPACSQFGAEELELVVSDAFRRPVMTVSAPCTDFELPVKLPRGNYEALARLVDASGNAISTGLPLRDIRIIPGSDLTIDIDFPSTSRI
jgi:hypothetical protein